MQSHAVLPKELHPNLLNACTNLNEMFLQTKLETEPRTPYELATQTSLSSSSYWYVKCFRKRVTYTMSACVACVSAVYATLNGTAVSNRLYIEVKVQWRKNLPVLQIYDNGERGRAAIYIIGYD